MSGKAVDKDQLGYMVVNAVHKLSKAMMDPGAPREDSAIDMSTLLGAEDHQADEREVLRQCGIQKIAAQQRAIRNPFDGKGYIEVFWGFHGCYSFNVTENTTGSRIHDMVAEKTGIPVKQQRLTYKDKLFRDSDTLKQHGIRPIYSTTNRPRLKLSRLEGICFNGADMDIFVQLGGSATGPGTKSQVHACHTTKVTELVKALLPNKHDLPHRIVKHGKVVYDSTNELWMTGSEGLTLAAIGVQTGDVLRLQLLGTLGERSPSMASIVSVQSSRSSRCSLDDTKHSATTLERSQSESRETLRSVKRPSMLRKVFNG
ncbi:hypothetical protein CLAFUW4_08670 [Fulvia fulva]|nr:hypothetical protein CLAFUR4_08672 [Fulvia fulva]WPV12592.1 hypothetical protein CLAFUW4_08670 [Fulvia fulva]WPV27452.1 hypothetical protein CLAFUW7_08667 [Fulvia fulva]